MKKTDPYTEKEIQTDKIRCVKNEFKNEKGEKSNPSKFHGKNADYAGTADYSEGGCSWTSKVLNTLITITYFCK